MIESFVDLTYRGLSLGRRIKLSQVRPSSGYLELAAPMPVGTHVAIATEDGVTFDATVSSVHEQVAGSDRTPGMVVVPVVIADPASSWWKARVTLPDEDRPAPRTQRNRPATQRPRSFTDQAAPPEGVVTEEIPATLADLTIRVATAAEPESPTPAQGPDDRRTTAMNSLEQEVLQQLSRSPDGESVVRSAEHPVIDDFKKTMVMAPLAAGDQGGSEDPDGGEAGEADAAGDGGEDPDGGAPGAAGGGDEAAVGRPKKRRKRR